MNETKLKGMLGLALRARQASLGMDACRIMIRSGKCGIMLLDGETGPNSRKKAQDMCSQTGVPVMILPAGMIAEATGKDNMRKRKTGRDKNAYSSLCAEHDE